MQARTHRFSPRHVLTRKSTKWLTRQNKTSSPQLVFFGSAVTRQAKTCCPAGLIVFQRSVRTCKFVNGNFHFLEIRQTQWHRNPVEKGTSINLEEKTTTHGTSRWHVLQQWRPYPPSLHIDVSASILSFHGELLPRSRHETCTDLRSCR